MQNVDFELLPHSSELDGSANEYLLPASGGGFLLPAQVAGAERFLVFTIEVLEDHSLPMNLMVYARDSGTEVASLKDKVASDENSGSGLAHGEATAETSETGTAGDAATADHSGSGGAGDPRFTLRFGLMPRVRTRVCIDLRWLDAHVLFPGHMPGQLKFVCHGSRIAPEEVDHVTLVNHPCFHDVRLHVSDMVLSDERPQPIPLPDVKLIDRYGQLKTKMTPNRILDDESLKAQLHEALGAHSDGHSLPGWNRFGGWTGKKLGEATGFFRSVKADGRWWLADPDGCAFFSTGPDCVVARSDCRVDGLETLLDWLPDSDDPEWSAFFREADWGSGETPRGPGRLFSFEQANLRRAFGDDWYEKWTQLIRRQLKKNGMNSLGNWSDDRLFGTLGMPYVTSMPRFPTTPVKIFRDFPDVFDPEYAADAARCADKLMQRRGDPFMIGYFLGNEPAWAFVNHLIIADEVLANPAQSACRAELIRWLGERHGGIEALNAAWGTTFHSFDALSAPLSGTSARSPAAREDMRAFSRILLERYIAIPSMACREADPEHMNLGLRWAWISDPDVVTGWEHFDVFSINCYAVEPTPALDQVRQLNVDRPVMIGEFHFGALDAGLTATGLEAVRSQHDRGVAFRHYCERVAAHPNGVGCHWFQCYDQFALGRFDGENYNIGLFDICSRPQPEMMEAIHACGLNLYEVMSGLKPPIDEKPESLPMIAY